MMEASRWNRLRDVLEGALDVPARERVGYIEGLGLDEDLRREAEALLNADQTHDPRLDAPAVGAADDLLAAMEGAALVGQCAGPYRLLELIAIGGMGEVFRAVRDDGAFERTVAVKVIRRSVLSPEARRRFAAERRLLARLNHPNIARLLDGGRIGDRPYIVLEYVEGVPLREYCEAHGLDVRGRAALMRTVCAAAAHAHQNLIVHRDIKPSNVIVTAEGAPKLLDFGISKLLSASDDDPTVTASRLLTPRYASPEQLRGEPVTTASDVYSLGVILHETLTGRAWGGWGGAGGSGGTNGTGSRQFTAEIEAPSSLPPGIDRELDAIVMQALAPEPAQRYSSAEALGADLERWLNGERVLAYSASRWRRARKWAWRHRLGLTGAVAAIAVICSTAVVASVMAAQLAAERGQTLAARDQSEQTSEFLTAMLESAGDRASGGHLTLGAMLDDAAARLESGTVTDPAVRGRLRSVMGLSYMNMGRHTDAGPLLRAAVEDYVAAFGADDVRVARSRGDVARHQVLAGEFESAQREIEAAMAVEGVERDPELFARLLSIAGFARMIQYDFAGAEALYDRALVAAHAGGHEGAQAKVHALLGQLAIHREDPEAAVRHRTLALEIQQHLSGASSLEVAEALGGLGEAHQAAGDMARAEALLREALAITTALRGAARGAASSHHRALALLLERTERVEEAERAYLDGIAALETGLPNSRHDWVYLRENYAIFLWRQGRRAEARPHFELAARTYAELVGPEHLRTQMAREMVERIDGGEDNK